MAFYPSRVKGHQLADERIARWLPVLILPLLVLMTVGHRPPFPGLWHHAQPPVPGHAQRVVLHGLHRSGHREGAAHQLDTRLVLPRLPAYVGAAVNYASITRNALRQDIKAALGGQQLPLSEAQYEAWLQSVAPDEAGRINGKLMYLGDWYGKESTRDLVDGDISFYPYDVTVEADTVAVEEDGFYYHAEYPYTLFLAPRLPLLHRPR